MIKPPIIILAYANNKVERGKYLRNLILERNETEVLLEKAQQDGLCELVVLSDASLERIVRNLQKEAYKDRIALFHFSGHANSYSLTLETEFQEKYKAFAAGFAEFLGTFKSLQLVFLNACSTKRQAEFLIDQNIPAVIATQTEVDDTVAKNLAIDFYRSLAEGNDINTAFKQAKSIAKSSGQDYRGLYKPNAEVDYLQVPWDLKIHPYNPEVKEWNLPDATEQPLWALPKPQILFPPDPYPGLKPYIEKDHSIFWGRDKIIRRLYQLLTQREAPNLSIVFGATQVGKTSLLRAGLSPILSEDHIVNYISLKDQSFINLAQLVLDQENKNVLSKQNFIIIDDLNPEDAETILQYIPALAKIRFILIVRTQDLEYWQEALKNEKNQRNYATIYLAPLSTKNVVQIINGGSRQLLKVHYNVEIEPSFPETIASYLTKDSSSNIAPVLQYLLDHLWKQAKSKNLESPLFNKMLFSEAEQVGIWRKFILEQLSKISTSENELGLFLQMLKEHRPPLKPRGYASTSSFMKQYELVGKKAIHYRNELLNRGLICHPAIPSVQKATKARLSHQVLDTALLELLDSSKQPTQQILRLLNHHLKSKEHIYLSEEALKSINQNRHLLPKVSSREALLVDESWIKVKRERRKKIKSNILYISIIIITLTVGFLLSNSPSLLLYLFVLLTVYQWSR